MNAFAQAAADLHADVNLSVELVYMPKDAPMIRGVRGIRVQPTDPIPGFGGRAPGVVAQREQLSIAAGALPARPEPGDEIQVIERLVLDSATLTVATVEDGSEKASWLLTLTRAKRTA